MSKEEARARIATRPTGHLIIADSKGPVTLGTVTLTDISSTTGNNASSGRAGGGGGGGGGHLAPATHGLKVKVRAVRYEMGVRRGRRLQQDGQQQAGKQQAG